VALCLLVTAAGCSLVIGTDGLAGDATSTGPTDAASPDADASLDAPSSDGATADASDAGLRGCALYADASFCQDFDDPTTALSSTTWTLVDTADPAGTISLVEAGAVSLPNAARMELLDASNGCESLRLSRSFLGPLSGLTVRAAVRPEGLGDFLAVVAAPTSLPGPTYRVLVAFEKPGMSVGYLSAFIQKHDSTGFTNFPSATLPFTSDPLGRDFVVSVEITAAPNPKVLVREGTRVLTLPAPADLAITDSRIDFGPYCQATSRTFTFDDIAIWAFP
jgi:hypothetical protein